VHNLVYNLIQKHLTVSHHSYTQQERREPKRELIGRFPSLRSVG